METLIVEKEVFTCPYCGENMYKLLDSVILTYVCPECGCSFDSESENFNFKGCSSNFNRLSQNSKDDAEFIFYIFNKNFMKKYTKFENLLDFIVAGRLLSKDISSLTYNVFKNIPKLKLDNYVRKNTIFNSWDDMFEKASSRYLRI